MTAAETLTPDDRELPFFIEPAQPDDAASILYVHQRAYVWGYENNDEPALGANKDALEAFVHGEFAVRKLKYWREAAERNVGVYVARWCSSGEVVGFGEGLNDTEEDVGIVSGMYGLPTFHRQGIGSALLRAVLADLSQPVVRLTVTRWSYAASFYEKRGFKRTGRDVPPPEPPLTYGIVLEQTEMELKRDNAIQGLALPT